MVQHAAGCCHALQYAPRAGSRGKCSSNSSQYHLIQFFFISVEVSCRIQDKVCREKYHHDMIVAFPHEKLHGIRRVSNPATRKDLDARTWGVFWYSSKCPVLFETMVQIKQKRGHGVETPHPRRFWCGIQTFADVSLRRIVVSEVCQMY